MAKKFLTDINIAGGVYDSSGDIGNSGQVLSSTGSGVNWINGTTSASIIYQDGFTGDGSATAFTLANSIDNENKTQVYIDGVYQHKDNYSLSGTTLTFSTAPPNSSDIEVISFSSVSAADDILYDTDFASAGLMTTNGSGVHSSILTNNSANWNTAYGWGDHGLSAQDKTDIGNLSGTNTGDQDLSSYATQSYVGTQITNLVDSSPATLNTLNELAAALGDDPNFATTTANSIGTKLPLAGGTLTGNVNFNNSVRELKWDHTSGQSGSRAYGFIGEQGAYGRFALRSSNAADNVLDTDVLVFNNDLSATFAGDVGIGTTSLSAKLKVVGDNDSWTCQIENTQALPYGLSVNTAGTAGTTFNSAFYTATGTGMYIVNNGRVGIGTTSPDVKLHIYNGDSGATTVGGASDELILENDTDCGLTIRSGTSSDGVISFADSGDHNIGQVYYSHGSNSMTFRTNDNTAVTIDSSQKVGIGTTSPSTFLQVSGQGNRAGGNIQMGLSSQGASKWSYLTGTHYNSTTEPEGFALIGGYSDIDENRVVIGGDIWETNPATSIHFWTHSSSTHAQGGTEKMRILGNGNVGIGTGSPGDKLNVHDSSANANLGIKITRGSQTHGLRLGVNDSHAFLWTTENQDLVFATNDSQRLTIQSGGNIGIGTSSPAHKLNIVAPNNTTAVGIDFPSANFDFSANSTSGYTTKFHMDNTGTYIGSNSAGRALIFQTNDTNRLYINGNTGNVGIGTTSPGNLLDVAGDTDISGQLFVQHSGSYTAKLKQLATSMSNATYTFEIDSTAHNSNLSTAGAMSVDVDSGRAFTINGLGNVGIGTNSPSEKLTLQLNTQNQAFSGKNGTDYLWFLRNEAGAGARQSGRFQLMDTDVTTVNIESASNRNTYFNAGRVGIGTTSPTSRLHVNGSGATHGEYFRISNGTTQIYELQPSIYNVTNNGFGIYDVTDSTYRLVIDTSGQVGIGTTSPGSKLDVKGASATPANGNQILSITNTTGGTQLNLGTAENSYGWIEAREGATLRNLLLNPNGGNVGIGTTSPGEKLQVQLGNIKIDGGVNSNERGLIIAHGGLTGNQTRLVQDSSASIGHLYTTERALRIQAGKDGSASGGTLDFWVNQAERMMIDTDGKVGIGTTSPDKTLTVGGTNTTHGIDIKTKIGSTVYKLWEAEQFFSNEGYQGMYLDNVKKIQFRANGDSYFNGGNVGIKTTSPSFPLDVSGIIRSSASNVGYLYLGNTDQSTVAAGAIIAQRSPSYSSTGKLLFQVPTWGANTDYGLTTQMSIEVTAPDTKAATMVLLEHGGNVGIGTTSPTRKLDVAGEITHEGVSA